MIELDSHIKCREFAEVRKIAVASEKNKTYRINNSSSKHIEKWRIDKCVFNDETTCDFLFLTGDDERFEDAYWVELKGSDIEHAAFQILSSMSKVIIKKGVIHHARIVPSKNPNPRFRGTTYRKLEAFVRANKGTIVNQNRLLEETI